MNISTEKNLLNDIVNTIRVYLQPSKIILFGSRSSHRNRRYSDFDIAIQEGDMDIRTERLLKEALDEKSGIFTIDVINLDKVDDGFKNLILQQGKVIYEKKQS